MHLGKISVAFFATTAISVIGLLVKREWTAVPAHEPSSIAQIASAVNPAKRRGALGREPLVLLFLDYADQRSLSLYLPLDSLLAEDSTRLVLLVISLPNERVNEGSFAAAAKAECAGKQGQFFEAIEFIMRHANDPTNLAPLSFARELMLPDAVDFVTCVDSDWPAEALFGEAELAARANVTRSPVMLVNGRPIRSVPSAVWLAAVLDSARLHRIESR